MLAELPEGKNRDRALCGEKIFIPKKKKKPREAQDGFIAFLAHISDLEIQSLLLTPAGFQSPTLSDPGWIYHHQAHDAAWELLANAH